VQTTVVFLPNTPEQGVCLAEISRHSPHLVAATDPPYNVRIDGSVSGLGFIHHREFLMASGEMSESAFTEFLCTAGGDIVLDSFLGGNRGRAY
jgi:hypothetical protein